RVGVPLKCLAKAGADVAKLDRPWSVGSAGTMTISVSRVALGALNEAEASVACPDA
ncbi:putative glycoside hydrolase, partial [Pseudoxanthomonas sp.]|uniref:putative glycoside hydrolase n=1 Tax=Pseudoxanthomonas sp. TaxID=1871049 RepID=UPI0025EFAB66